MIECLLESSPEDCSPQANASSKCVSVRSPPSIDDDDYVNLTLDTLSLSTKTSTKISSTVPFERLPLDYISMEEILRVCSSLSPHSFSLSSSSSSVVLMFVQRLGKSNHALIFLFARGKEKKRKEDASAAYASASNQSNERE